MKFFLFLTPFLFLSNLSHSQINDFPEKGWNMFPAPRASGDVGLVYGTKGKQGSFTIGTLDLKPIDADDIKLPDREFTRKVKIGFISNWLFKEVSLGPEVDSEKEIKVTLKLKGAKRKELSDQIARNPFCSFYKETQQSFFDYDTYFLRREVISATEIEYIFDEATIRNLKLDIQYEKLVGASASINVDKKDGYRLTEKFDKPMNIFYHDMKYNPKKLAKSCEKFSNPNINIKPIETPYVTSLSFVGTTGNDNKDHNSNVTLRIDGAVNNIAFGNNNTTEFKSHQNFEVPLTLNHTKITYDIIKTGYAVFGFGPIGKDDWDCSRSLRISWSNGTFQTVPLGTFTFTRQNHDSTVSFSVPQMNF